MLQIVDQQKAETDPVAFKDPGVGEMSRICVLNCVSEVAIQIEEESDEIRPGAAVVSLHVNPFHLLVCGKGEPRRQLKSYDSMEIIVAGVDQVADGLLAAPFATG